MDSFFEIDQVENTSGQGSGAYTPPEVKRWNWGAFFMTWIWGLKHRVYISLFWFVPFIGWFLMPLILGYKGSSWAWQYKRWNSIEEFRKTQQKWGIFGAIVFVLFLVISVVLIILLILWIGPIIIGFLASFGTSFNELTPIFIFILNLFGINGEQLFNNQMYMNPSTL